MAPKKVTNLMERRLRSFLWSNSDSEKPYHLVNWEQVCFTKEDRGLGIKKFQLMNKALISKWCWRYGNETNALWRKLIIEKFGYETRWAPKIPRIAQGVGCWKRILSVYENFNSDLLFDMKSGADIRFWLDSWLDGGPLSNSSPQLFSLSKQKRHSIRDMTVQRNGETVWNLNFSRELNDFEEEEMLILLLIIGSPPDINDTALDICRWRIAPTDKFSVKSYYDHYRPKPLVVTEFPYNFIWLPPVPTRVKFFAWTACLNKCLTVDNLNKRGLFIVSRCPLCKASVETLDHILLHCVFSAAIWNAFLPMTGWCWCMPPSTSNFALSWKANSGWSSRGKILWSIMPIAIWWGIWLERNARTFQKKESSQAQVISRIRSFIFSWCSIIPECNSLTLTDVTLNWDFCLLSV